MNLNTYGYLSALLMKALIGAMILGLLSTTDGMALIATSVIVDFVAYIFYSSDRVREE